jgi:hypothetical protein
VCRKSRSIAAVPVSVPAPVDRECDEVCRDEASGGEGCDAQPGAGRGDETGSAKVADVHMTDGLREQAGPDSNRQQFVDNSRTDRPQRTVIVGRELAAETVSSGSRYRLAAAPPTGPRPADGHLRRAVPRGSTRRPSCTDRSLGRSRECCWHGGVTVLRTAPVGRCGSADFSAGKYGGHATATNPAWDWASHTQARPRYTEPGRVRPAGSLCMCVCVTHGRITL